MGRQVTRWLLCGLVPVLAMLSAHGIASHAQEHTAAFNVTQGSALVANGAYTIALSDEVVTPARITTAGQVIEGLAMHHARFESFVIFRVDAPEKYVMFLYPGMSAAGASTYGCRSAQWEIDELRAIDDAPEVDLDLAKLGGSLPVCAPKVDIDAAARRIRISDLPLQRVSTPSDSIVISTTLQYRLP